MKLKPVSYDQVHAAVEYVRENLAKAADRGGNVSEERLRDVAKHLPKNRREAVLNHFKYNKSMLEPEKDVPLKKLTNPDNLSAYDLFKQFDRDTVNTTTYAGSYGTAFEAPDRILTPAELDGAPLDARNIALLASTFPAKKTTNSR
jgi:hypothetical protein